MSNGKKLKLLPWLIGVFAIAAVFKVLFWYCFEREDLEYKPSTAVAPKADLTQNKNAATALELNENPYKNMPGLKAGSFTLKVDLPLNEKTTVHYVVPVDVSGKPLPSASNIVFYAPYGGEAKGFVRKPWISAAWHRYFPEVLGFTIFSMTIEAVPGMIDDKKQFYIYKECGWHEIVFNAQQRIIKEFNLSPKPLLVFGQSSGGSMAQQMAAEYPDKIDAAAWNGGASYKPLKSHSNVAWLAMSTWGDIGVNATINLKKQAEQHGTQILRSECPPDWKGLGRIDFHHPASETAYKLIQTFIRDIVKLRDQNGGKVPPPEKWPVTKIIAGEKQCLPSLEFADLWQQLPHEATKQIADVGNQKLIVFPYPDKVSRIVFFVRDDTLSYYLLLQDELYFLAQEGAIPVSVKLGNDCVKDVDILKKALVSILSKTEWRNLPVYIIGKGIGGQLAAVAALSNGDRRIKRITTLNADYESPFDELSIAKHRATSNIPLKMIYGTADFSSPKNAFNTEAVLIDGVESSAKWFLTLAEASR